MGSALNSYLAKYATNNSKKGVVLKPVFRARGDPPLNAAGPAPRFTPPPEFSLHSPQPLHLPFELVETQPVDFFEEVLNALAREAVVYLLSVLPTEDDAGIPHDGQVPRNGRHVGANQCLQLTDTFIPIYEGFDHRQSRWMGERLQNGRAAFRTQVPGCIRNLHRRKLLVQKDLENEGTIGCMLLYIW